jgi:hypothetical protein
MPSEQSRPRQGTSGQSRQQSWNYELKILVFASWREILIFSIGVFEIGSNHHQRTPLTL